MADERFVHTLQTTALVHEALLRLLSQPAPGPWENREHFLAAAARAMRHVLVDRARRRATLKRETPGRRVELEIVEVEAPVDDSIARRLLALDESLDRLRQRNPVHAQIVELRFFGELTMPEIAEVVGISLRQAERSWRAARAWLHFEVEGQND